MVNQKSLQQSKLNKFGVFYKKTLGKLIPYYAALSLIFCVLFQIFVFYATKIILNLYMPASERIFMETFIDLKIPLVKPFVAIYFLAYLQWAVNYILATRISKEHWYKCALSYILGLVITLIIFMAMPSTMARPQLSGNGFFDKWMEVLYFLDEPTNIFPSLHCFASMISCLWIAKEKHLNIYFKVLNLIFAVLVFASTLFVKQHCLLDVAFGVLFAFVCYALSSYLTKKGFSLHIRAFDKLNTLVFIKKEKQKRE